MKQLLTFLLGGLVFICLAAGTTSIMTVKPATPKSVFVKYYEDDYDGCVSDIKSYSSKGFVVSKLERLGGEMMGRFILTMEKY